MDLTSSLFVDMKMERVDSCVPFFYLKERGIPVSLIDELCKKEVWEQFYEYKTSLACPKDIAGRLRLFIDEERYIPVVEEIRAVLSKEGDKRGFPLPKRSVISKQSSQKKRVVYTYPDDENTVLKLLTYLILRKYDGIFYDNLFSFRAGRSAQYAVNRILRVPGVFGKYTYKVDVSNYFNSIPVERLIKELDHMIEDDPDLLTFLKDLLTEERVTDKITGKEIREQKGIMAGTPLASFYANLYLRDLDGVFFERKIPYFRYSDDIIVLGDSYEEVKGYADEIKEFLTDKGLNVNPSKEEFKTPDEGFVFLGFYLNNGKIDVAPASVKKLKQKMRRKTRALERWKSRNRLDGVKAAKAFIRVFNHKLFESLGDNDLSWSHWYFSLINTTESLHMIDLYAQDCIRYLVSGSHTKKRYNVRYDDIKSLGYQSLVHAYYSYEKDEQIK